MSTCRQQSLQLPNRKLKKLPETPTLSDEEEIIAARAKYNELTKKQKAEADAKANAVMALADKAVSAAGLDTSVYDSESVSRFRQALDAARAVLGQEGASTQEIEKALAIGNAKGKVSYKRVKALRGKKNYSKYFKVNSKTGKITVIRWQKKGTLDISIADA